MIFNKQTLLSAFDKKGSYHSPKCFSTVVVHKLSRFEPKDYPALPTGTPLEAYLYSIWEDKYTTSIKFMIVDRELVIL